MVGLFSLTRCAPGERSEMASRSWARQGSEQLTPWHVVSAENLPSSMESRGISIQQFQEGTVLLPPQLDTVAAHEHILLIFIRDQSAPVFGCHRLRSIPFRSIRMCQAVSAFRHVRSIRVVGCFVLRI